MAPAGTPEEVVSKLSDAMGKAVEDAEYKKVIEGSNLVPTFKDAEEMKAFLDEEADRYGPWIKLAQGK
jgi:tripartite-type tricarboxylate transporter receptor subunit TctC